MSTMKERLHTGELYFPMGEEIMKEQMAYQDLLCEYNLTKPSEVEKRAEMLKKCLVTVVRAYILRLLFIPILAVIIVTLGKWCTQTIT